MRYWYKVDRKDAEKLPAELKKGRKRIDAWVAAGGTNHNGHGLAQPCNSHHTTGTSPCRLSWSAEISSPSGATMPAGSANLYQYPFVAFGNSSPIELDGEQLEVRPP